MRAGARKARAEGGSDEAGKGEPRHRCFPGRRAAPGLPGVRIFDGLTIGAGTSISIATPASFTPKRRYRWR